MKKLLLATLLASMYSTANAGIQIPAGDWTLDIGGVVNAYYTNTRGTGDVVVGGLGGPNATGQRNESNITTGLLPNVLSVSGKSRQNDLDIGFTIAINPGASTTQAGIQTANQENRQAFLTIGDKSWGSVKLGKDLGIFASDAILNDMTLLGVGAGAGALAGNTTTLGRIGSGYMYADWKSQVAYTSPNFNGFSFTAGVTQAWNAQSADLNAVTAGVQAASATSTGRGGAQPAFEGKVSYSLAGPIAAKVWSSAISQKVEGLSGANADSRAYAWDVGTNLAAGPYGLTAYYFDGKGIGRTLQLADGFDPTGQRRDSNGGYVQGTYTLPTATKLGVSYGQSKLDRNSGETATALVSKNEMWTFGAYHALTKSVNLVAEYSDVKSEAQNGAEGKSRSVSAGAILFF
jgi:predicted porin